MRGVKSYMLYIDDDRYTVPTLESIIMSDDERALETARARLAASAHYVRAEVWDDNRLVERLEKRPLGEGRR